jgi:hypothetical protein
MRQSANARHAVTMELGRRSWPPAQDDARRPLGAQRVRQIARQAESLELHEVALELFFAAERIEATGRVDLVGADLAVTARCFDGLPGRFYRRAVRRLGAGPPGRRSP